MSPRYRVPRGRHHRNECAKVLEYAETCTYCGRGIDPTLPVGHPLKATCDHLEAVIDGGIDSADNYVPACSQCNSSKGRRSVTTWLRAKCAPPWAIPGWCINPAARRPSRDW